MATRSPRAAATGTPARQASVVVKLDRLESPRMCDSTPNDASPKCRPVAHIRYRLKASRPPTVSRVTYTPNPGSNPLIRRQVHRRHQQPCPDPASPAGVERTPNGRPSIHRARRTSPAATSARIAELETSSPMRPHRLMQMHRKPELRAKLLQLLYPRLGAMPKAEVAALVQRTQPPSPPPESRRTNSRAGKPASAASNRSTTTASMPCPQAAAAVSSNGVSSFGACSCRRNCSGCGSNVMATDASPRARLIQPPPRDLAMPKMHAVEVPDHAHRWAKPEGISPMDR
jgi:hypothetical protein